MQNGRVELAKGRKWRYWRHAGPYVQLGTLDILQLDRGASAPAARGGHAIASIGSKVICFGGADRSPTPFSDLWELDTGTNPLSLPVQVFCASLLPPYARIIALHSSA